MNFGGTSASSPHAAGIAALIRSRFPVLNQQEVRDRIKKAAEYYWSSSDDDLKKYGAGKVNAYRALTEWGSTTDNVTWNSTDTRDAIFYISGDFTVEAGDTLTINKGVTVRVAPDHLYAGFDPAKSEIIVKGTLIIDGDPGEEVVFEAFNDTTDYWWGIRFDSTSTGNRIEHLIMKDAWLAVDNHGTVDITNTVFSDCGDAVHSDGTLTMASATIHDVGTAVNLSGGTATFDDITVHDCAVGISLAMSFAGTLVCHDSEFRDITTRGLTSAAAVASSIDLRRTTFDNVYDAVFLALGGAATVDSCTIDNSDIGVTVIFSAPPVISHCTIDSSTTNGIYATAGSHIDIENNTISNGDVGVFLYANSHATIESSNWIKDNDTGIKCDDSDPVIRLSKISDNDVGISALNDADPDVGVACGASCEDSGCSTEGANEIVDNASHHIVNVSHRP